MIFKKIYKIIPIPIFYTERLMKKGMDGRSFGFFILIRPRNKKNTSLLEHELIHCRQFYKTLGLHGILYSLSRRYRLKSEIEAYVKTIEVKKYNNKKQIQWIINLLYSSYNLNMPRFYIMQKLYKKLNF